MIMSSKAKERIVQISNEILDHMLVFREEHTGFTFSLRHRDSAGSEVERLSQGQWFQGDDTYILVPFFRKGDNPRRIKTLGFVLEFSRDGAITKNFVQVSFKGGIDSEKGIAFHKALAEALDIRLGSDNVGKSPYTDKENYIKNLDDYLDRVYPVALNLVHKYHLEDAFIIDEKSFEKDLAKILEIKKTLLKSKSADMSKTNVVPLNTILFGPPGTGKTYNTINLSLEIIGDSVKGKMRKEIKELFQQRVSEGRIQFATFHQSMNYEDFIEGIKPKIMDNQVIYELEDGIFKRICDQATVLLGNFEEVIEKFKQNISELDGKPPLRITAASTAFDITFRGTNVFYVQPLNTVKKDPWYPVNIQNMRKVLEAESFDGIYNPTYVREIINFLKKNYGLKKGLGDKKEIKPYVLIIDEINRGNISQIFGELITLIEDDKREGGKEAISVILPYSKESFSVPGNVYIIGTMNTADRSIEAMDTALRRRFVFREMPPLPDLISPAALIWKLWWDYEHVGWKDQEYIAKESDLYKLLGTPPEFANEPFKEKLWKLMKAEGMAESQIKSLEGFSYTGIDLSRMLDSINTRIEKLLNKDYKLGHAYFIYIYSLADLKDVFKNKILPLLQEYFFGDFGRIGLVIGETFIKNNKPASIVNLLTVKGYDRGDLNEVPIYQVQDPGVWDDDEFTSYLKAIYA
jgi:5-methylcytosine-specific restriction endonuclease McrBC GTP-binding regulatory subunit McrB